MHTKFEGSARKQNAFSAKTVCEFFTFPTPLLMKKSPFEIISDKTMNQSNTYHQNLRGKFLKKIILGMPGTLKIRGVVAGAHFPSNN